VIREQSDLLQWLIYFEAEKYERQGEQLGRLTKEEFAIRYVKYLVQITTPMSSLYVNIGVLRLLYNYSTAEARSAYEWTSNHYPGTEEYRRIKGRLMIRLQERFGEFLKTCRIDRGEVRFVVHDDQDAFVALVRRCLNTFTPWSIEQGRLSTDPFSPIGRLPVGSLQKKWPKGGNDTDEVYRAYTFIHPPCLESLARKMRLDPPEVRLAVPRSFRSDEGNNDPPCRRPDEEAKGLTASERDVIERRLDAEAARRRQTVPQVLQIVVDGIDCVRFCPSQQPSASCNLQEGAKLIEIRAQERGGSILFATHWIDYVGSEFAFVRAAVDLGKKNKLILRITPNSTSALLFLEYYPAGRAWLTDWLIIQSNRLSFRAKYRFAAAILLLTVSIGVTVTYRTAFLKQRIVDESVQKDLGEKNALLKEGTPKTETGKDDQSIAVYRLRPDSHAVRGAREEALPRLTLPPLASLVSLELPVDERGPDTYRARLRQLAENKTLIAGNDLKAKDRANGSAVTFLVPSLSLAHGQYYVIELDTLSNKHRVSKTETFTFYVEKLN
jgi:hypothetical protein